MKRPSIIRYLILILVHATISSGWISQHGRRNTFRIPAKWAFQRPRLSANDPSINDNDSQQEQQQDFAVETASKYDLGLGKNRPVVENQSNPDNKVNGVEGVFWNVPDPVAKPPTYRPPVSTTSQATRINTISQASSMTAPTKTRRMVARDNDAQRLRGVIDEDHFQHKLHSDVARNEELLPSSADANVNDNEHLASPANPIVARPKAFYPDIDLSIPNSVYCPEQGIDLVWDLLRWEAYQQAQQEPLLVSFLHSTILNHRTLESSLAFLLANRLQSPAMMISTQLQSLILEALRCNVFRRALRADMMAVRDRDPACAYLPDVFLYFKGFHALQSHRVAHVLWQQGRQVLALYLQSQVSQIFQIDIHPNATLGSGIMLDHGTGIVVGETVSMKWMMMMMMMCLACAYKCFPVDANARLTLYSLF
jgi:hypothetical protein